MRRLCIPLLAAVSLSLLGGPALGQSPAKDASPEERERYYYEALPKRMKVLVDRAKKSGPDTRLRRLQVERAVLSVSILEMRAGMSLIGKIPLTEYLDSFLVVRDFHAALDPAQADRVEMAEVMLQVARVKVEQVRLMRAAADQVRAAEAALAEAEAELARLKKAAGDQSPKGAGVPAANESKPLPVEVLAKRARGLVASATREGGGDPARKGRAEQAEAALKELEARIEFTKKHNNGVAGITGWLPSYLKIRDAHAALGPKPEDRVAMVELLVEVGRLDEEIIEQYQEAGLASKVAVKLARIARINLEIDLVQLTEKGDKPGKRR